MPAAREKGRWTPMGRCEGKEGGLEYPPAFIPCHRFLPLLKKMKRGLHMLAAASRIWIRVVYVAGGLAALIWFLVRVVPKPSRAAYPCQRAAFPLASSFVVWVLAVWGSTIGYRRGKAHRRNASPVRAAVCFAVALAAAGLAIRQLPSAPGFAATPEPHGVLGAGQGIFPGRVVWVHAPEATDWEGYDSEEHWWGPEHTDLATVEGMMSRAVRELAGVESERLAWQKIFRHFNQRRGNGDLDYQAGEKIAIKINLTTCNARGDQVDRTTYNKLPAIMNRIDNSPQMILALLRQLVYTVGVAPADITVGDPTGLFPNYLWNQLHPEFPAVHYLDNYGGSGRTRAEFSETAVFWSTEAARGKRIDYIPVAFAEADYLINFALLKGHSAGITVCAKNHYGSLLRCPDGYLRELGRVPNFYNLHDTLPESVPGMGHYRALVDLMAHRELGDKTMLHLVDGLYGGYYWEAKPRRWKIPPFGDGISGDWPSSLFASLDPVAIDSVCHDFLLAEWPGVVTGGGGAPGRLRGGAEDYLHEAAAIDDPPSGNHYNPDHDGYFPTSLGVHEHWNNPVDKQYSRNLGVNAGIELLAVTLKNPAPPLAIRRSGKKTVLSWPGSMADYSPVYTDDLRKTKDWRPVVSAPVLQDGFQSVAEPADGAKRFYRLIRKP